MAIFEGPMHSRYVPTAKAGTAVKSGEPGIKPKTQDQLPADVIAGSLTFANEHQLRWWNDSGRLLARLLRAANYDIAEQYQYLLFAYSRMIPALGPYPQRWRSTITTIGVPLEYSINYQEKGREDVRIGFEPVDFVSGTPEDPYNIKTIDKFVDNLERFAPKGFNREIYDRVVAELFPSAKEVDSLYASGYGKEGRDVKTAGVFGLDLKGGDISVKGYCFLLLKHLANKVPVDVLMPTSLLRLGEEMGCLTSLNLMHEYLLATSGYHQYSFFAWDFAPKKDSRLKFYSFTPQVSLKKVEDLWTLGGRVNNEVTSKGLELVRRFWELLGIKEQVDDEIIKFEFDPNQENTAALKVPLLCNYEVHRESPYPVPKLYFPTYGLNDLEVAHAISRFFRSVGWVDRAESYPSLLAELFPDEIIEESSRIQTWISFSYTEKTGPYVSIYYRSAKNSI
ncbi:tryptophan dimethylallyltransferase-domain-containing protein [Aspergillus ambiguus]|uniref:tryptophan dimethylallyltransferase-domain-containing protein n=1 Tax=Aspergillus ambiguus TaxID=176160 RepID=UPI003CCD7952